MYPQNGSDKLQLKLRLPKRIVSRLLPLLLAVSMAAAPLAASRLSDQKSNRHLAKWRLLLFMACFLKRFCWRLLLLTV